MNRLRVGYIGVGLMGHGAAKNILEKGYPLAILGHRNRTPVDDLVSRGAVEVGSALELMAQSEVIFLCLPSTTEVEAIMLGADGLIQHARPGLIVVDSTTADPNSTRRLSAMLAAKGCGMIDAPLGRSPKEAELGKLSTYLAGAPADIEQVRPIIECYAEVVIVAGDLGAAHALKLINNFISIGTWSVVAEAVACAHKLGVNLQTLFDVVSAGNANSNMFQVTMPWVLRGDDSRMQARISIPAKDMRLYCRTMAEAGLPAPLALPVSQFLDQVCAEGHGDRLMPLLPGIVAAKIDAPIRNL
jgi:3-hydroxyisobutyrate dehydrogenase-like beta-hydroxyacid dehydrogenase